MRRITTFTTSAAIAAIVLAAATPAVASSGYSTLGKSGVKKIVSNPDLAPANLGTSEKSLYVWTAGPTTAPFVCWSSTGEPQSLPPASAGTLGYTLTGSNTAVGTTVTEYPTLQAATEAGTQLMGFTCPKKAKMSPDAGAKPLAITQANSTLSPVYGTSGKLPSQGRIDTYETSERGVKFVQVNAVLQIGRVVICVGGGAKPGQREELTDWALAAVDAAAVDYQKRAAK